MKYSLILQTAAKLIVPLMLLFSVFLLLRGHDEPGGGFIGGLVAGSSFALYAASFGTKQARESLGINPLELLSIGLGLAVAAGLIPFLFGQGYLTGLWVEIPLPGGDYYKTGSPILFDIGVYLLVIGTALVVIFELDQDGPGLFPRDEIDEVSNQQGGTITGQN